MSNIKDQRLSIMQNNHTMPLRIALSDTIHHAEPAFIAEMHDQGDKATAAEIVRRWNLYLDDCKLLSELEDLPIPRGIGVEIHPLVHWRHATIDGRPFRLSVDEDGAHCLEEGCCGKWVDRSGWDEIIDMIYGHLDC